LVVAFAAAVILAANLGEGGSAPIAFIKVAEVQRLLQQGAFRVSLVDVRSRDEYLARHIAGAISIPLNTIEARADEIPRQGLVVLY
jgi:rhodanese-related sulfurtransferase